MNQYKKKTTILWKSGETSRADQDLIAEEPLSIRIQGAPYSVIMRTPGDEKAHVAGFCLGEGLADSPGDIAAIAFCDGGDTNVVTVTLTPERRNAISDIMDRREFISQTSCGLCGKEIVADLYQKVRPVTAAVRLDAARIRACLEKLADYQPVRKATRAAHAAAIFDKHFSLLSVAEDVGRHNALDKAVGKLFLDGRLHRAALLVLSSRVSYELVQKAARARIPVIAAVSRPTALAVDLAKTLDIAVACQSKGQGLCIFCSDHRIIHSS